MYQRLRDGLFAPGRIIRYIKDKGWRIFLQLLLYAVLLLIPVIINVYTFDGIDSSYKTTIKEAFNGGFYDFFTNDTTLSGVGKTTTNFGMFSVIFNPDNEDVKVQTYYNIEFNYDKVYIYFVDVPIKEIKYSEEARLQNFYFSKLCNPSNTNEWDAIFSIVDDVISDFMKENIVIISITSLISEFISLVFVALIISLSFLFRFRGHLNYKAMFKMSVYYTAPYVIGNLLATLFNLSILSFIGLIVCIIYTLIGSKKILTRILSQERK